MKIKGIIDTDTVNYKKICMTIEMPKCDFKCDRESGSQVCQNCDLAKTPDIDVEIEDILIKYIENPLTEALCFQGLEPFDSWEDMYEIIRMFRRITNDDIVIYTGYKMGEIEEEILKLMKFPNVIVKFGRFIPNNESKFEEILGVTLASSNQFAVKIS